MQKTMALKRFWGEMVFVVSAGSGIPILFLHGTGCDTADWEKVTEQLPDEQYYIALDFRGHGQSSIPIEPFTIECLADDVLYLIYALKLQKVVLVGHSLGGMVAMETAKREARVKGLVLLEGWTNLSTSSRAFNTGRFYGSLSHNMIKKIQHKAGITRDRFLPRVWQNFWTSVRNFDSYAFLEKTRIPVIEVYGEMGRIESTEKLLDIPSNPNIRLQWVPDAGHYLPHEYPQKIAAICRSCIADIT